MVYENPQKEYEYEWNEIQCRYICKGTTTAIPPTYVLCFVFYNMMYNIIPAKVTWIVYFWYLLILDSLNASAVLMTSTKAWSSKLRRSSVFLTSAYLKAVCTWVVPCSNTAPVHITRVGVGRKYTRVRIRQETRVNKQQTASYMYNVQRYKLQTQPDFIFILMRWFKS